MMVVDDNELICQGVRDYVDWAALDTRVVATCADGREGYETALRLRPDIVITDVDMPFMTGLAMASRLKGECEDMDFIFVSCYDDFNFVREAMDLRAFKYVLKPIVFEELTDVVRLLCAEKKKRARFVEDYRALEQREAAHAQMLKERLMLDIALGRITNPDEIAIQMNNLRLGGGQSVFATLFISRDGACDYDALEALRGAVVRCGALDSVIAFVDPRGDGIGCVLPRRAGDARVAEEESRALLNRLSAMLGANARVGISSEAAHIGCLPELYDMARQAAGGIGDASMYRYDAIVNDIKAIIRAQYADCKSVEQIVKPLYISASHANLIFKRRTGMSIFDFLTRTRMGEARKLLGDPYLKIGDVAERVGYRNYAHFSAAFKEYYGATPKAYRNRERHADG